MTITSEALSKGSADMLKAFTDAATDVIGRAIATMQREARQAEELRSAEHRTLLAEHRAWMTEERSEIAGLNRQISERLASLKDGADGRDGEDGAAGRDGIDGANGTDGKDGADGADGVDGRDGTNGIDGKDGTDGTDGRDGIDGAPGTDGKDGADGIDGTAGADGRDGADGINGQDAYPGEAKGLHDPAASYRALDVVGFNGCEWRAKRDDPGPLPGDGWMLSASRGKRGERGAAGPSGHDGESIVALYPDREAKQIILTGSNGSEFRIDLRDVAAMIEKDLH